MWATGARTRWRRLQRSGRGSTAPKYRTEMGVGSWNWRRPTASQEWRVWTAPLIHAYGWLQCSLLASAQHTPPHLTIWDTHPARARAPTRVREAAAADALFTRPAGWAPWLADNAESHMFKILLCIYFKLCRSLFQGSKHFFPFQRVAPRGPRVIPALPATESRPRDPPLPRSKSGTCAASNALSPGLKRRQPLDREPRPAKP